MRNLALCSTSVTCFPERNITASVVDLEENYLWLASERLSPDADIDIELWRTRISSYETPVVCNKTYSFSFY